MSRIRTVNIAVLALSASAAVPAGAGELAADGSFIAATAAELVLGFEATDPTDAFVCESCDVETVAEVEGELALEGAGYLELSSGEESLRITLLEPLGVSARGRYEGRLWVRHARALSFLVRTSGGVEDRFPLYPTGRVTSDGWVEVKSGPVDVDAAGLEELGLEIRAEGIQVDAFELVRVGEFQAERACLGAFDPVCAAGELCVAERCRALESLVPPLPSQATRASVAEYLMQRVRLLFGGRLTRQRYMPAALAEMSTMLSATSAAEYWGALERGVRILHDAHTVMRSTLRGVQSPRRLGVCFIEGRGELSHSVWPSSPGYKDVLVSHVGEVGALGLQPGDRLVAVDGQHPVEWARSLVGVNARFRTSTDPDVYSEFVEQLHDQIPSFARTFSVVRCDSASLSCSSAVTTIEIAELPLSDADTPGCDNRPLYHQLDPPEGAALHRLESPWRSRVAAATRAEAIFGVTWNDLLPAQASFFRQSNQLFKAEARGVILDHRTGNGGVLDAPQAVTELVRMPALLSIGSFMNIAGDDGPSDAASGQELFNRLLQLGGAGLAYEVGSANPDLELPVALLLHRDTSASDWLPHGMKGAPNVRIFGPHETAGAFSSFYQFDYWSGFGMQLASGDTVTAEGELLIGHGALPDEVVEHTQASLLRGVDAPYARALEWVRSGLK